MQFKQYPSYKPSGVEWLGDVPKHWSVIPSKFYFIERKEKAENKDKQLTASQKYGIVFQEDFMAENGRVMVVMKNPEILKKVRPNDFVISMRSFQGGLELSYLEGSISSAYVMLKPNLHVVDIEYFKYLFKTPRYIQSLQSTSNLIRDGQALRFNNFSQVKLVLPPKSDQHKIVSFLDTETARIDNLIAKQEKLIELLEEQRKSIISHAVTKGLNPNAPMKDSGVEWLGDVPSHWEVKPNKYIFKIQKLIAGKLGYDVLSITQKGLKVKDIESNAGQMAQDYSKYQIVNIGDFAMNHMDLLTGWIDVAKQRGVTSPDYRVFKLKNSNLNKQYFLNIFQMQYKQKILFAFGQGAAQMGRWRLQSEAFNKLKMPYPCIKEQVQIADFINHENLKINKLISKQQALIEKLKEYRASIISHAVTGKIDVREFVA